MRQIAKNYGIILAIMMMCSKLFAIAGIGVYGNYDMVSHGGTVANEGDFSIVANPFDNAYGVGLFLYVDAIPIVDLEVNMEFAGNLHDGTFNAPILGEFPGELPWARASTYFTIRKKIVGLSVPFLAKANLYAGGGLNKHSVTPTYSMDLLTGAFPGEGNLTDIFNLLEGDPSAVTTFANHVADNMESYSGLHLQAGCQAKLLMLSLFANARYTIAKDVIPDKAGFLSVWLGLGLGI